jgi:beta-glucosidase
VQQDLVEAVAGTGTPLVVVVLSGRVHTLGRVAKCANAVIWLAPPGEEGGAGLADVLTGAINPSGRLPVSLPRAVGQVPVHMGVRAGGERAMFFGDYTDSPATALFAFGHGLSYTQFSYADLAVHGTDTVSPIEVAVSVRNEGNRLGDEVVQVYCRDVVASVARPQRMLVAFARVSLTVGEIRRLVFTIDPSRLAFYGHGPCMVTEPGEFIFSVGASSADIRAECSVVLAGDDVAFRQSGIVATLVRIG